MKQVILILVVAITLYGQQVVLTLDAPADKITGLGVSTDALWAVSSSAETVFKLNTESGAVISSFSCKPDDPELTPNGLACAKGRIYVAQWSGITPGACRAFQYMPSGEYIGKTVLSC